VVDLDISNTGRVVGDGETGSGGYGLAGMRQRVGLYGGELDAGPRAGGGFAVRARIPTGAGSA
jgi:signal transduction histidine kinase